MSDDNNTFSVRVDKAMQKIKMSKSIISKCIDKYGQHNSYVVTLNKLNELEILLEDSYETTKNGLNKSNKDAKNNFLILFDTADKVYNITQEFEKDI